MTLAVLDCCSLLNLFAGWGGLAQLSTCGGPWHVCEQVISEAVYVMEPDLSGTLQRVPLNLQKEVDAGHLMKCKIETEAENELLVRLAVSLDDGEAASLAIAKARGWTLVTDDIPGLALAKSLGVPILETPDVLKLWGKNAKIDKSTMGAVVARISTRARFTPPKTSAHHAWWLEQVKAAK
jgi:predicted nucleic acid-binding protein